MPKKTGHKRKRGKKTAAHHFHPTSGGHHERLRQAAHGHHPHRRKRAKSHAHPVAEAPRKHHRKRTTSKRASTDRRVTEQTLRDHMALNCVRRCAH
jgi:hypothetical protein